MHFLSKRRGLERGLYEFLGLLPPQTIFIASITPQCEHNRFLILDAFLLERLYYMKEPRRSSSSSRFSNFHIPFEIRGSGSTAFRRYINELNTKLKKDRLRCF